MDIYSTGPTCLPENPPPEPRGGLAATHCATVISIQGTGGHLGGGRSGTLRTGIEVQLHGHPSAPRGLGAEVTGCPCFSFYTLLTLCSDKVWAAKTLVVRVTHPPSHAPHNTGFQAAVVMSSYGIAPMGVSLTAFSQLSSHQRLLPNGLLANRCHPNVHHSWREGNGAPPSLQDMHVQDPSLEASATQKLEENGLKS